VAAGHTGVKRKRAPATLSCSKENRRRGWRQSPPSAAARALLSSPAAAARPLCSTGSRCLPCSATNSLRTPRSGATPPRPCPPRAAAGILRDGDSEEAPGGDTVVLVGRGREPGRMRLAGPPAKGAESVRPEQRALRASVWHAPARKKIGYQICNPREEYTMGPIQLLCPYDFWEMQPR
jgi:hypothetical protein